MRSFHCARVAAIRDQRVKLTTPPCGCAAILTVAPCAPSLIAAPYFNSHAHYAHSLRLFQGTNAGGQWSFGETRVNLLTAGGESSRSPFQRPDSTAFLFRLMDFYCDALMYFHSGVDIVLSYGVSLKVVQHPSRLIEAAIRLRSV